MRFHVLSIFPEMFVGPLSEGIIGRARRQALIDVTIKDIRDHAGNRHRTVDDYAFGGGPGMVMKPGPLFETVEEIRSDGSLEDSTPVVLVSPQGRPLTQQLAQELAQHRDLVIICGRYEGVDERARQHLATMEISIGDYVLSGGELAAMVLIDAVSRLIPGVVGSQESTEGGSFATGLLQHPQYTRPAEFRDWAVPDVLLSGNHAEISRWRRQESLRRTWLRRPDLLQSAPLSEDDFRFIEQLRDS